MDFREESIYFLLPARFYDGDPSNNVPTEWSSYNPDNPNNEITDPEDVSWRGDFKGLIEHGLDYIQDLGFTAVWLTPIVHNRSPLDYHGYHAWDFNRVDPRLESPGYGYQEFIDAAHARGMKVIQDVVWNHSGRYGIKDVAELKYNTDPDSSWYAPPNPDWEYDGITPNPDDGKLWSRANLAPLPAPYNQDLSLYNWPSTISFVDTSDPDWFHHSGNGFAQGWDDTENLYNRALADDTPDLNTESQVVRDYLVDAYTRYIDMGVDAFRVDTVKHMARDSVLYFVDAFKAHDPDLFLFGEVAQKRHELHQVEEINPHWYTWDGAVGSSNNSGLAVLDFYAQATFHGVFEYGHSFNEVQAAARYDHLYSDPSTNVMWLDNHDFGPNNDWNRRFSGSAEDLAGYVNFTWTWRGIPSLYYGTEIQFKKGAYTDIHEAADINRSLDNTGRAYYGDNIFTASSHPLYQHIKKMNAIRKALPALQKGSWYWAGNPSNGNGVGYVRSHGPQTIAVGIAKGGSASFNFDGLPAGTYRDAVTGAEIESGGSLSFNVEPGSAGIYVLNGPGLIGGLGAGFFQSSSSGQGGGSGDGGSDDPWDQAYFRGTANGWAADAMSVNPDTGLWETTGTFGTDNPRFKIDRYGDWSESYPAQDYLVQEGPGEYLISFDDSDRSITLVKLGSGDDGGSGDGGDGSGGWNQAYFRGTANGWAADAMSVNPDTGLWETTGTFGTDNPRFKIDRYGDWSESYPAQDYLVEEGAGEYMISFDAADQSIQLEKLSDGGDQNSGSGELVVHFAEYESASRYILHSWDGLSGDFSMEYEGNINNRHWWSVTLQDVPDSFLFCFTNSNGNWDGENRSYSAQGGEIYILPRDATVYLTRP
ncbi:Cellulose-binding domain protein [Salinispira pacifica]|uniref:Cellulose-binding domain protein n=1 Tax=Salinispira pacifica TaxID=1307761 RepID=V5WEH2_9SPIO|nr:Cellulose-binding domain protein [Salinispira pacifica]